MTTIQDRISSARTHLAEIDRQHQAARSLLAKLDITPAPVIPSAAEMLEVETLPNLDKLVSEKAKYDVAALVRDPLQRFVSDYRFHEQQANLDDFPSVLAVLRVASVEVLDQLDEVRTALGSVSSPGQAIDRGMEVEWRQLKSLTNDLNTVVREYVRGIVASSHYENSDNVTAIVLPQSLDDSAAYDTRPNKLPIINERYALWVASAPEDQCRTLRALPDADDLGSEDYLPKRRASSSQIASDGEWIFV